MSDACFASMDSLPANPGDYGELQGNNVSVICFFIWSPDFSSIEHDT